MLGQFQVNSEGTQPCNHFPHVSILPQTPLPLRHYYICSMSILGWSINSAATTRNHAKHTISFEPLFSFKKPVFFSSSLSKLRLMLRPWKWGGLIWPILVPGSIPSLWVADKRSKLRDSEYLNSVVLKLEPVYRTPEFGMNWQIPRPQTAEILIQQMGNKVWGPI